MRHFLSLVVFASVTSLHAAENEVTRTRDVIYGRKFGVALTMDVFTPKKANGIGIIDVMSGSHQSDHSYIDIGGPASIRDMFLKRGYTVFSVVHGSLPKVTVEDIIEDVQRSVRFVRHNADRFHINGQQLGAFGISSGGHLSLMLGTLPDEIDPDDADPVGRESARVQAVACFYPPTDYLNYDATGKTIYETHPDLILFPHYYSFEKFHSLTQTVSPITDRDEIRQVLRKSSPIYHVSSGDAPTFIVHGDADPAVSLQQSQSFVDRMKEENVETKLIVKEGEGHGWNRMGQEVNQCLDCFDKKFELGSAMTE